MKKFLCKQMIKDDESFDFIIESESVQHADNVAKMYGALLMYELE